jgi:hypothetical protein
MSNAQLPTFPSSEDAIVAPYTDGLLASDPTSNIFMPPIGGRTHGKSNLRKQSGHYCETYYGNTSMVFADRVWHPVFAGDF